MKLIGGNISDSPVKNVHDGSAFSVGGAAAGMPDHVAISAWGSGQGPISATNWAHPHNAGAGFSSGGRESAKDYCVLGDGTTIIMVQVAEADDEVGVGSIPTSSGVPGTPTAAQILSADFTTSSSGGIQVFADPGRADGIVIILFSENSARKIEIGHYTLSSGTFSRVGSIISHTLASDSFDAFNNAAVTLHPSDGNSGVIIFTNNTSTSQVQCMPFNYASNQKFGTSVASGVTAGNANQYGQVIIEPTGEVVAFCNANRILEWALTTGTTPSVAFAEDHSLGSCGSSWHQSQGQWPKRPQTGSSMVQLETPTDPGEAMIGGVYGGVENYFSGVTAGKHNPLSANPQTNPPLFQLPGNTWSWTGELSRFNKVDEVNGWVRGVQISAGLYSSSRYTPLYACPVMVSPEAGWAVYGDVISSTNVEPRRPLRGIMNSVLIDNILTVFVTDGDNTTSPDMYMSLTVTP